MMRDRYIGGETNTERNSIGVFQVLGVFVSGHKFYVCDFRTKHKICIL
jgi:hypothetical protein